MAKNNVAANMPVTPPRTTPTSPFKDQVQLEWDAVAEHWGNARWWRFVERSAQACNDRLVALAHVEPGQRVLDVGTGVGEPAVTAARRVGPVGHVLGIDLSRRMIEVGRQRVQRLGLSNVDLEQGDAESLHLPPGSFDAILSRWTLMLFEDLGGALSQMHLLLVPGGRLAAGLWGHPSRVPMISVSLEAAMRTLGLEPPPQSGPGHLWTQGLETLEHLAREAGFVDVHSESLELSFDFPSPQIFAEFVSRMAGPLRILLDQQPEPMAQKLIHAIREAAERFRRPDGSVRFINETLLIAGRRLEAERLPERPVA